MGYWKSKVLPKIKKVFDKSGPKKAAAAEALKSFDESKEEINKEFEEKKEGLKPKVLEIYEACSVETKTVIKERTETGVKKNSAPVTTFLEELVKIDFPGSKPVFEASTKFGASYVSTAVLFVFEKVSTFIPVEEVKKEEEEAKKEEPAAEASAAKEVVVEEEKKVEEVGKVEEVAKVEKEEEAPPPPPVEPEKAAEAPTPEPVKAAEEAPKP